MKALRYLLVAGLLLCSFAALAQDATPDNNGDTGKPDDEVAVTKKAADNSFQSNYQAKQAELGMAYSAYQDGHYADAASSLENIVKKSPKNTDAQELLAYCDLKLGKPAEAAPHLEVYTQAKPTDYATRDNLGFVYLQLNRTADALSLFQAVLAKSPKDAQAEFGLATAYHANGQDALAADAFSKTTTMDPKNVNAWLYTGLLDMSQGAYDKAIPPLKQAIALKTDDAYQAHTALAQAYITTKDIPNATSELKAASSLKPTEAQPVFNLAVLEQQSGDTAQAEADYRKVLALKPTDLNLLKPAQANLGLLLAKDGDPDTALPVLTEAAQSDPASADVQCAIGLMDLKKNDKADAKAAYQKALAIDPTRADAKAGLAASSQ